MAFTSLEIEKNGKIQTGYIGTRGDLKKREGGKG